MTIEQAVINMKELLDNGNLTGQTRSGNIINNIHEAVKYGLVNYQIDSNKIFPPIGARSPELQLAGFIKRKKQDICVIPNFSQNEEILQGGILNGIRDEFGYSFTEKTLSINVRSQISSIQKNFDTLFERTYAESLNLHLRCPKMVLGEVYLLSIYDYTEDRYISQNLIEKYIRAFHSISHRDNINYDEYKYEATCLLIVDFTSNLPKIYDSTQELINDELLDRNTTVRYEGLEWNTFFEKILNIYDTRFGISNLT